MTEIRRKTRSEAVNLSASDGLLPHAPRLPPLLASWARLILSSGIHKAPSSDARLLSLLSEMECEALLLWGSLSLSYFVTTLPPTSAVGGLKWYGMAKRWKGDWSLLLVWSPPLGCLYSCGRSHSVGKMLRFYKCDKTAENWHSRSHDMKNNLVFNWHIAPDRAQELPTFPLG